jgi:integrase
MEKSKKTSGQEFKSRHPDTVRLCFPKPYISNIQKVPKKVPKKVPNFNLILPKSLHSIHLVDYNGDLSKKWYLDVHLIEASTGQIWRKKYSKNINKFNSVAERTHYANDVIQVLIKQLHAGHIFAPKTKFESVEPQQEYTPITFQRAFQIFIDSRPNLAYKTIRRYKATLAYLIQYEKTHKPILLKDVKTHHIQQILDFIQSTRAIQPKTYNHYRNTFAAVCNHFVKSDHLTKSPVLAIPIKKVQLGKIHYPLSLQEISQIKELALKEGDNQFVLFISFIFYTLARPGRELRFLKVKHILEDSFWISAENSKPGENRRIELLPPLRKIIAEQKILSYPKEDFVFSRFGCPGKEHVGIHYFYKRQVKYLAELNLSGKNHDLYCYKHSGAIQMIKAGFTPFEVMKIAGHKDVKQTQEYLYNIGAISMLNGKGDNMPEI